MDHLEMDEMFHWQINTPFCTLLEDIGSIDGEDGIIDSMLDQIELSEIRGEDGELGGVIIPGAAGGGVQASSTNLSTSSSCTEDQPVSSPLWPCDLHAPVVMNSDSGLLNPVVGLGSGVSDDPSGADWPIDPVGSPQSSTEALKGGSLGAPVTPPPAKPKRTRATKATSRKNAPKAKKQCRGVASGAKESRLVSVQGEHIMRERQRRDDMAAKYLILESLLPPAPKQRERAVTVETAISFVKDLQQKRDELLKRRDNLKQLMAPSHSPRCQVQSKKLAPQPHDSCKKLLQAGENCGTDPQISSQIMAQEKTLITSPVTTVTNPATTGGGGAEDFPSSGSVQRLLHVHVHFSEEEIVIEMVCHQPRQNFHSFLLQAVDSFGLDITRCSINREPHGFVQCIITCTKSQTVANPSLTKSEVQTSATLIGALRNVLSAEC